MHTARTEPYASKGIIPDRDPPGQRPPWTETPWTENPPVNRITGVKQYLATTLFRAVMKVVGTRDWAQTRIYCSHIFIMFKRKYFSDKSTSTLNVSVWKDFQIVEETTKNFLTADRKKKEISTWKIQLLVSGGMCKIIYSLLVLTQRAEHLNPLILVSFWVSLCLINIRQPIQFLRISDTVRFTVFHTHTEVTAKKLCSTCRRYKGNFLRLRFLSWYERFAKIHSVVYLCLDLFNRN